MAQKPKIKAVMKIFQFFKGMFCRHSSKTTNCVKSTPNTEEFERCVLCSSLTCIPISMPVDRRVNYEIGIGQICSECAKKLQADANRTEILSCKQILLAVEQCRNNNNE